MMTCKLTVSSILIITAVTGLSWHLWYPATYSNYFAQAAQIDEICATEQFDSAIVLYDAMLAQYPNLLSREAYNACQVAALIQHTSFDRFFEQCSKCGIPENRLHHNVLIRSTTLLDTARYTRLYKSGYAFFTDRIDTGLRSEWQQRARYEQEMKGKPGYAEVVRANFERILELAKENRFPGEHLVGMSDELDHFITPTLLHYPYSYTAAEEMLWNAADIATISPGTILYVYSFNQTRTSVLYRDTPADTVHFKLDYNIPFGRQSTDYITVNANRRAKNICSIETEAALKRMAQKNGIDYMMPF